MQNRLPALLHLRLPPGEILPLQHPLTLHERSEPQIWGIAEIGRPTIDVLELGNLLWRLDEHVDSLGKENDDAFVDADADDLAVISIEAARRIGLLGFFRRSGWP